MVVMPVGDACVVGVAAIVGDGACTAAADEPGDGLIDEIGVLPAQAAMTSALTASKVTPARIGVVVTVPSHRRARIAPW
jgi:hypothetical protein